MVRPVKRMRGLLLPTFCLLASGTVFALTTEGPLRTAAGPLEVRVYAPDWIWQSQPVNVLVFVESRAEAPVEVTCEVVLAAGQASPFVARPPAPATGKVVPGRTLRTGVVGLQTRQDVPLGVYPLRVTVRAGNETLAFDYPLRLVRGQPATTSAGYTIGIEAAICVAWCVVIGLVLRRYAQPGAWRRPSPPYEADDE